MNANRFLGTLLCLCTGIAHAQFGRGDGGWSTLGGDAQRTAWVRNDPKISPVSLQKPGFQMVWKLKLNNDPRQMNGLTPPPLLERYIGIKGFRTLGFVGGSSDNIYGVDLDLGRTDWQTHFSASPAKESTPACPGGMTANTARSLAAAFPAAAGGGRGFGGGGRGTPAKSAVGEPGEGSVILAELEARAAAAARGGAGPGGRGGPGGGRGRRMPVVVYALSSDGMLHTMYVSNGVEPEPPVKFLAPNANAQALSIIDGVAYVFTTGGCGGVANGMWALDLESKEVTSWKADSGGVAGSAGPAFGGDGTLYVATTGGDLVSLEAKTLKVKDVYRAGQPLSSTPVIFQHNDKTLIAVATKDGSIHVLDGASMAAPVFKTLPDAKAAAEGALATWQDSSGTRWILTPTASTVAAWKVVDRNGTPALEAGWVSRDLVSPLPPTILNGVVFAASGGGPRTPAVLYALDGTTGKELWSSGKTITSFVRGGGIAAGGSQIYLGTNDGTFYAFGFPMEH